MWHLLSLRIELYPDTKAEREQLAVQYMSEMLLLALKDRAFWYER
jgi:hypothetical protein